MLDRRHRLTSPRDFRRVIRSGRKIVRPHLVVHAVLPVTEGTEAPRVGVTVSKAVGGSVVRHRVARIIRHAVVAPLANAPAGSLWVIRALPPAGSLSSSRAIREDVASAMAEVMDR